MTFLARLRTAAEAALILGVQAAIVVLCLGLVLFWLAGDYSVTRARALNGQRAYEALVAQAQKAAPK